MTTGIVLFLIAVGCVQAVLAALIFVVFSRFGASFGKNLIRALIRGFVLSWWGLAAVIYAIPHMGGKRVLYNDDLLAGSLIASVVAAVIGVPLAIILCRSLRKPKPVRVDEGA